ncbi:hypothetical protein HZC00_01690 [Candidatus Kaiserbacteria bacterium]|nr:hypothetical protein [Candidatus Kaiserbacteria bacterium]
METELSHTDSVISTTPSETSLAPPRDSWRLVVSAILSVIVVATVAGWRFHQISTQKDVDLFAVARSATTHTTGDSPARSLAEALGMNMSPNATSSTPEEISQIGPNTMSRLMTYYSFLEQSGSYTPELGAQIAASIAPTVQAHVPYTMYDEASVQTDPDTSYRRMRAYRTDLQKSFAPFSKNTAYELDLYNDYMQTHDEKYLSQLKTAAQNYRDAATLTAKVVVPTDAVSIHVGVLNALQEFSSTLTLIADNIHDPITSLALLSSYNKAEDSMTTSFAALDTYYASKKP